MALDGSLAALFFFVPIIIVDSASYTLVLRNGVTSPDCFERIGVLINESFPGPTLRFAAGEHVEVNVVNQLEDIAVTMHWHGVLQKGSPWADGTFKVNDCGVLPGSARVYKFVAPNTPGEYMYHGHAGLENTLGAAGMMLVDPAAGNSWPDALQHDEEVPLFLNDFWHEAGLAMDTELQQLGWPTSTSGWPGNADSLVINGRGRSQCAGSKCSCPGLLEVSAEPGKVYMLRIASASRLMMMNLAVEGHTMTLVAVDGLPVRPVNVTSVDISSGQRLSVLLRADQAADVYWISLVPRGRDATCRGQAVLRYVGSAASEPSEDRLWAVRSGQPTWDDNKFALAQQRLFEHPQAESLAPKVVEVHKRFVLLSAQETIPVGKPNNRPSTAAGPLFLGQGQDRPENHCSTSSESSLKWTVSRSSFEFPTTPLLHSLYYGTADPQDLTEERNLYHLELGQTYEVVLQNYPSCNGACETHPWHMHGHDFWVVGTWPGEFNGTLPHPGSGGSMHLRDTTTLVGEGSGMTPFPGHDKAGCGYTVIRFKADNPGVWAFHCHLEFHFMIGMFAAFYTSPETLPAPPDGAKVCGEVTPKLAAEELSLDQVSEVRGINLLRVAVALLTAAVILLLVLLLCQCSRRDASGRLQFSAERNADFDDNVRWPASQNLGRACSMPLPLRRRNSENLELAMEQGIPLGRAGA